MMDASYPVQFSVDYPDRPLNRLTTLFRIFTVIPIAIVLGTVSASTYQWSSRTNMNVIIAGVGGLRTPLKRSLRSVGQRLRDVLIEWLGEREALLADDGAVRVESDDGR